LEHSRLLPEPHATALATAAFCAVV
jgi:hypothetical protein